MRRRLTILTAALVVALAAGGVALSQFDNQAAERAADPASQPPPDPPGKGWNKLSGDEAKGFKPFALYDLGPSFAGLPLRARVYGGKGKPYPGEPIGAHDVLFVYGTCELPPIDGGCAPPLQVQVWPACRRNPAVIDLAPDESVTVRGLPAHFYEDHTRLEFTTGRSTVVLFDSEHVGAEARQFLLTAAEQLRGVNVPAAPVVDLPAPAEGALNGRLRCGDEE